MATGDYVTTTMKDYVYYPVKRTLMILPQRESCNALVSKETLLLPDEIAAKSDSENYATPQEYLKKVLKENPNLEPQFEKGLPSDDAIRQEKKDLQKTVYFVDYCIPGSDIVSARTLRKQRIFLPKDAKIPETTQRSSYRDPKYAAELGLNIRPKPFSKPSDNLALSEAVKNAMQIKTGLSEYQYAINQTGNLIIEERLVWRAKPNASAD